MALIAIGFFGTIVLTLLGYVYLSTASYVRSQSDSAIKAEQGSLQRVYNRAGRGGLVAMIQQRISDEHFQDSLYLLTDPSFSLIAGNLKAWPAALMDTEGWQNFRAQEWRPNATSPPMLRAV
ncbi:MAG: hypothetical protein WCF83_20380, partial [Pseudolabrys sp.]